MKNFIGREREIAQLKRLYDGSDFQSALVYGRRRIGKITIDALGKVHPETRNAALANTWIRELEK